MRNEETWNKQFRNHSIERYFPPRLQRLLKTIPVQTELDPNQNYYIFGETNTGKTVLAAQIFMERLKYDYIHALPWSHYTFVSFPEMLTSIRQTYAANSGLTEAHVLNKYSKAECLLIDDFLTARTTDWVMDILYYIINHRYEWELQTIITTNKSLAEMEAIIIDQRITSRIDRSFSIIEKQPYKLT